MITETNMIVFKADAEEEIVEVTCEACGDTTTSDVAKDIDCDETFALYTREWSVSGRHALFCPDCRAAIKSDFQPNDGSDEAYENRFER